jgi:hypothetical protein
LRKLAPQKIADALRKFGMRVPKPRPEVPGSSNLFVFHRMIGMVLIVVTLQMVCMMLAWEQARLSAPETLRETVAVEATTRMARITDEQQIAA